MQICRSVALFSLRDSPIASGFPARRLFRTLQVVAIETPWTNSSPTMERIAQFSRGPKLATNNLANPKFSREDLGNVMHGLYNTRHEAILYSQTRRNLRANLYLAQQQVQAHFVEAMTHSIRSDSVLFDTRRSK